MKQVMEKLLALQKLELDTKPLTLKNAAEILKLREQLPAAILSHFDRLVDRGKKGVAIACKGVCGECHLRLPSGTMAALVYTNEVHLCDNCERYLYLPEDEPLGLTDSPPPAIAPAKTVAKRTRKKALVHVA
jgi:hypothetical protein